MRFRFGNIDCACWVRQVALLAVMLLGMSDAQAQSDRSQLRLQLQWSHQAQFAGFYVAAALGFYEREALEVEFIAGGFDAGGKLIEPLHALTDGKADVAIAWLSSALLARRAGDDFVNIAQVFRKPATTLLCRRDAGIRSVADARGKTIGVWNVGDQYDVAYWLRTHDLSVSDATLVEQRPDGLDLIERKVACATATTYNEYWKILRAGVAPSDLIISRNPGFLEDGVYVRRGALDDPAQAGRLARFLRASAEGWRYAADNFDEALAVTLARTPDADPQHQRRMLESVLALAEPRNRFGLLDLGAFEHSVGVIGFGVNDPRAIAAAADQAWTHRIWYAARIDAADRSSLSVAVRHYLASVVGSRWFYMLDLLGTMAFGFAGFMRAQQRRYDLWGAFILMLLPAVGGGTLRDLLIGGDRNPPFIFSDPAYLTIVICILIVGSAAARFLTDEATQSHLFTRTLTVLDTIGLSVFAVIGAKVALMEGLTWFWVPICAALTCSGGGMLLDIVTGREPRTFQGEPYEEIAVAGGLFMYCGLLLAGRFEHATWMITAVIAMTLVGVFFTRLAVVHYGWRSWRLGSHAAPADG